MFIALGNGDLSVSKIIKQFSQQEEASDIFEVNPSAAPATSTNAIEVVGLKGMLSSMALLQRCLDQWSFTPVDAAQPSTARIARIF
jgi:hypothetical protein